MVSHRAFHHTQALPVLLDDGLRPRFFASNGVKEMGVTAGALSKTALLCRSEKRQVNRILIAACDASAPANNTSESVPAPAGSRR